MRRIENESPSTTDYDLRTSSELPQNLVGRASYRLRWLCLLLATITTLILLLETWLQRGSEATDPGSVLAYGVAIIVCSLIITAIQHYHLYRAEVVLNLGLAFEVLIAAFISAIETSMLQSPDVPIIGCSKVALWIVLVGSLLPNQPWKKLLAALCSASTWPIAYYFSLTSRGLEPLPFEDLIMWLQMSYLAAGIAYAISARIFQMEKAVDKVRDLGSYRLATRIGTGGMGQVWKAQHRMLARDAAIKLIRPDLVIHEEERGFETARRRLRREATAIASLRCPHTVYLFDFGVSKAGSLYYVMELLDGISLETMVSKYGPISPARAIYLLMQVCDSLAEAHEMGLIHRDIKPSNIFSCKVGLEYDFVKVLDFGLVKQLKSNEGLNLTVGGTCVGTPAYIAPEVALGGADIDCRVDIYGLGCVAYFLLTGSTVFPRRSATASAIAHVHEAPIPPSKISELPIPVELDHAILRCLAKLPSHRPSSVLEVKSMLASIPLHQPWTPEQAEGWWKSHRPVSPVERVDLSTKGIEIGSRETLRGSVEYS